MYVKSFLLMIAIFLFPYAPIGFVGNQAYADKHCCDCGECNSDCVCNGTWPCWWCAAPKSGLEASQAGSPDAIQNAKAKRRGIPIAVLSSATDKMISDIRQSHGPKNLMLKLVDISSMKYDLKFSCSIPEDDFLQGERLGIQARANTGN